MIGSAIRLALAALFARRLRSSLTALGIMVGTAAVAVVVALGTGARERIGAEIANIGENLLFVFSRSSVKSGARVSSQNLSESDAEALRVGASAVQGVTVWSTASLRVFSAENSHKTGVMGVDADYFPVRGFSVDDGRLLSESDLRTKAKVLLIGATVRERLFGRGPGVGQWVRIGRHVYQVVGILEEKGRSTFEDQDDRVLMPITSWRARIAPASGRRVQLIMASAKSPAHTLMAEKQVTEILRYRHGLREGEPDDFMVRSQEAFREAQDEILDLVETLLLAVALVALFVGGVGVMNIMLVGVAERTREIGVRMALGARRADIWLQFIVEASLLTLMGGILGIVLSTVVIYALTQALGWSMLLNTSAVLVALLTSTLVGLVFGLLPARRAADLDPIEALRQE